MTHRHSEETAPYSAAQMFDLVADVEQYPQFIPYCVGLRVMSDDVQDGQGTLIADMLVAYKLFREKFRSNVVLDRKNLKIDVAYVSGPFRHLTNQWRFEPIMDHQCHIYFDIDFEFKNPLLQAAASAVFERAFVKMTDAFLLRAGHVYGAAASTP